MTVAGHPAELELLALVEGELSRGAARAVEQHLGACATCRTAVETQQAMRAVLRGAPAGFTLAPEEVRALVRALPAHPLSVHPRPAPWWRRRPALVLAPAFGLAVAAVAAVISLSNGTPEPRPTALKAAPTAAAGAPAGPSTQAAPSARVAPSAKAAPPANGAPSARATPPATAGGAAGAAVAATGPGALLAAVAGTPAQVVAFLRARGIVATVQAAQVLVREADGPRARAALAGRPSGPVRVLVR